MKSRTELKAERDHKLLSCDDIVQKARVGVRPITAEERAEIEAYTKEIDAIDVRIVEIEASEQSAEVVKTLMAGRREPGVRKAAPILTGNAATLEHNNGVMSVRPRYSTLRNFKGEGAEERAYASGQWCLGVLFGSEKAKRWCANKGMETRAQSEGNNLYGGALVPDQFGDAIIDQRDSYGTVRQEARIVPMATDHMDIPTVKTGVTASFYGEAEAFSESTTEWETTSLTAKKMGALVKVSSELAEDSAINIADWLAGEFGRAFAQKEDDCCFKGTGTAAFGGIFGWTSASRLNNNALAGSADNPSTAVLYTTMTTADVDNLLGMLPQFADGNSKFYCSKYAYAAVFQALAAAGGGNTVQSLQGKFGFNWMGYPIVMTPSMPTTTGTLTGEVMMIYGDMRMATILGDRRQFGMRVLSELYAANDQIGLIATERIDIVNHGYGDASLAGSMVAATGP